MANDEKRSASVSIGYVGDAAWLTDWQPGYALPSRFSAAIDADWLAYPVELELVAAESKVRCVGLTLNARDGGKDVAARDMRKVPLGECIRLATTAALRPIERTGNALTIQLMGPTDATEASKLASRGPQRRVTDKTLRETADIYLHAEHKPTDAVHRLHSEKPISYSTAARWVMKARERGFIPPTKEKKR